MSQNLCGRFKTFWQVRLLNFWSLYFNLWSFDSWSFNSWSFNSWSFNSWSRHLWSLKFWCCHFCLGNFRLWKRLLHWSSNQSWCCICNFACSLLREIGGWSFNEIFLRLLHVILWACSISLNFRSCQLWSSEFWGS